MYFSIMPNPRDRSKVVLAMVGLPARGKTYTARKIARYLSWLGHKTRVFNVGSYRREHFGASQPHDFFAQRAHFQARTPSPRLLCPELIHRCERVLSRKRHRAL